MGDNMFGHDNQHHQDNNQPAPDGTLSSDNPALSTPQINDIASDYIEEGPAPAPTVTQPDTTAPSDDVPPTTTDDSATTAQDVTPADTPDTDNLLDIKQKALEQLTPLVGHLEQSAEEEFRTTMMMIQASDNHTLIQRAYDAALRIEDDKIRARALLDIVNEINYFTHGTPEAA